MNKSYNFLKHSSNTLPWPFENPMKFSIFLFSFSFFLSFFFFFFLNKGYTCSIWKFPGYGSNQNYSCQPTPQPEQRRIQATSVTYSTAHGTTESLTHWAGPGIEPITSWILVGFISSEPQQELKNSQYFWPYTCSFNIDDITEWGKLLR